MFGAFTIAPKYSLIRIFSVRLLNINASVAMSDFRKFTDSSIYVAFPDKPAYFTKRTCTSPSRHSLHKEGVSLSKYVAKGFDLIMLQPNVEAQEYLERYIKTGIVAQKIIRKLPELKGGWALCYSTTDLSHCMDTTHGGSPKRGVFVYLDNADDERFDIKKKIIDVARIHGLKHYCQFTNKKENIYKRVVFSLTGDEENEIADEEDFVCEITPPLSKHGSPKKDESSKMSVIFSDFEYSPVFPTYKRSRSVLQKCSDYQEVIELLKIADRLIPHDFSVEEMTSSMKFPFIVVEGMDATGKTTLTKSLENKMKATRYYTPPPPIEHLRKFFDAMPEIVRRAYYTIGNYIVAVDIAKECSERAVIMDRYWHSTTAYGIANETSSGDQPPTGHCVYQWPNDLLKPNVVLFLNVSEEIRKQRIKGRSTEITFEEIYLDKDQLFRQRLCDSYLKMENPGVIEIDASGSVESVKKSAIAILKDHGIDLSENENT